MSSGTVTCFSEPNGYGFIKADNDGAESFFNKDAVSRSGLNRLSVGSRVHYDIVMDHLGGKKSAQNIGLIIDGVSGVE
ncbi:MAG: cold shock domain-containing protein [Rhodospirillum sp.]|nr:cold shock domain-containing protein [Rhodospirillum sp.]MCF8489208.1 cold shock domain-containing protein [Rhodospirillum sp.]MCF8499999.1 cold shock domain-containing protein [Rhodospirillum sp.]